MNILPSNQSSSMLQDFAKKSGIPLTYNKNRQCEVYLVHITQNEEAIVKSISLCQNIKERITKQ
jgi:hypothetical protein